MTKKIKLEVEPDGVSDPPPVSLRLTREQIARLDRLKGIFGESRTDVMRTALMEGALSLEERKALGQAELALIAFQTRERLLTSYPGKPPDGSPAELICELEAALAARDVPRCIRLWQAAKTEIGQTANASSDQDVVIFEGEIVRAAVGSVRVLAGRPGWGIQAVRELLGEKRCRAAFG